LFIGLLAASQSGNIIRIGDAHFVAIAAWRLLFASVLIGLFAGRGFLLLKKLSGREIGLLFFAGIALCLHFFTWIGAVQHTSVANAAMVFSINPIFCTLGAHFFFKERFTKKLALSIALGLTGAAVICGTDFSIKGDNLKGDLPALISALFFAVYFLIGKRMQQTLPTDVYVSTLCGIASLLSFAAMPVFGIDAVHFSTRNWMCFALMALIPTMIGHTALNYSLRHIDAGRVSASTLLEPLFAGLVALAVYGERIYAASLVGYAFIAASVLVLVVDIQGRPSPAISAP
jgi:drug/metabolite transporter (DMT)-like permease